MASPFQLLVLACCAGLAVCYRSGAPRDVCRMSGSTSRRPVHADHMPQWDCPPYKLYHNLTDGLYRPGEAINVTLEAEPGAVFKGFLVTADSSTSYLFGTVNNLTAGVKGVGNCGMTHMDNNTKTSVSVVWIPANIPVGTVQFKAVVVQNYSTYWEGVRSPLLFPDKTKFPSEAELRVMMAQAAAAKAKARGQSQPLVTPARQQPGAQTSRSMGLSQGQRAQPSMTGPLGPMQSLPQGSNGRLSAILSRQRRPGHRQPL